VRVSHLCAMHGSPVAVFILPISLIVMRYCLYLEGVGGRSPRRDVWRNGACCGAAYVVLNDACCRHNNYYAAACLSFVCVPAVTRTRVTTGGGRDDILADEDAAVAGFLRACSFALRTSVRWWMVPYPRKACSAFTGCVLLACCL